MKKILFLLLAVLPLTVSAQLGRTSQQQFNADASVHLSKFVQFYGYLTNNYIDSINNAKLIETAIRETLATLDPHSVYMSPAEMRASTEQFQGNFSGIGVEYTTLNDTLMIVNTISGGPAEKVGVLPNDRIIMIDGKNVIGIAREKVPELLRGPRGSIVNITVMRQGVSELLNFRIVRDNIPITTLDAAYNVDDRIGYIRVNRFAANTMDEFNAAVTAMGGIEGLILDLRSNGGGFLGTGIEMSNFFLRQGNLIVSTEGMRVTPERYVARSTGRFTQGKVIVLIDEFSASASEIVAGALQDWDRAVIIGRRSFGKGLVQRQFSLNDGSAVRITIARYLTPTGRAIQRPFELGHSKEYYQALSERITAGHDILNTADTHSYKTLRLGRPVYGGGGIFPDIYVEEDTTAFSPYFARLSRMGVINDFLVSYLERNRTSLLAQYPTFDKFYRDFTISNETINELTQMGERRGIPLDRDGLAISRNLIGLQLKAIIAQKLWTTTEYYRIMNSGHDPVYRKALDVMRNWDTQAAGIATKNI